MVDNSVDEASERIRRAALELFSTRGFGSTNVDQVATEAGVGVASFYRRWPDKVALANEILSIIIHDIEVILAPIEGSTPKQRFLVLWRRIWQYANEHPARFAFLEGDLPDHVITAENAARKRELAESVEATLDDVGVRADRDLAGTIIFGMTLAVTRAGIDADSEDLGNRLWQALRS